MNAKNFAKGVGVGMAVGAAMSMSISAANKKNGKQHHQRHTKQRQHNDQPGQPHIFFSLCVFAALPIKLFKLLRFALPAL